MTLSQEAQILKLQLSDDGRVWYADGMATPVPSDQERAAFVRDLSARGSLHARVLGTADNAKLIVDLYQQCCSPRKTGRLEVAAPTVCTSTAERRDPSISLYRMRQCLLPPSLGGWHQVNELDYPAYAIAAQLAQDGKFTKHTAMLLETHPVYHDLMFLPTFDRDAVAQLLAIILDPRWFVDIRNPYRLSRLKTYLGLSPRYMQQVTHGGVTCERSRRCAIALQAWKGIGTQPTPAECEQPGNFLWRRWRSADSVERGNLRATQAFITYFVRTWQQQLVSKSTQQLEMFRADSLLKGSEVFAYQQHSANRQMI